MAEDWSACISSEMEAVESLIENVCNAGDEDLSEMCRYVLENKGKRLRPAMALLSFRLCQGEDVDRAVSLGAAIELIHNATLIHDDINDEGELRRGVKSLYREYSIGKSIVTGDYIFVRALGVLGSLSDEVIEYVVDSTSAMARGEFIQKRFERDPSVTVEDYMTIIREKTAHLIACCAKCGAYIASPEDRAVQDSVQNYALLTGQAFQITDDLLDIIGEKSHTGKRPGNDIVEGKPTLPTIYGMQDPEYGDSIRRIFEDPDTDYGAAAECIELIKKTEAVERCKADACALAREAISYLDFAEDSVYKTAMKDLACHLVRRDR